MKNCTVQKALDDNFWINHLNLQQGFEVAHIHEFVTLWDLTANTHLDLDTPDSIQWKFTTDGKYSASSAYKMQFEGLTHTNLNASVWKVWAPPKCKFFAWLVLQNRIWTADRLQKRGWPNCGNCPLCNRVQESADHLLYKCRFTIRIWKEILAWCGMTSLTPAEWANEPCINIWWTNLALQKGKERKAMASMLMLVSWELWKERNARVFRHVHSPSFVVLNKIKDEARSWSLAGAWALGNVIPGE